ncbi:T9SS type A sorting domain-containing protein [candidate division KSB1 bacterium]|nr:T9SS type A sorting domain-containing protein [candidate division KSB1 bacterium]
MRQNLTRLLLLNIIFFSLLSHADFPEYATNPFTFSVPESPFWGTFFVADLDNDDLPDFTFRSETTLYAYRHNGSLLWYTNVPYPGPTINNYGVKHGAADVDGDGNVEVVALNNSEQLLIFDGASGDLETTYDLPPLDINQLGCHVAIVNLRNMGDRDAIIQTCDVLDENHDYQAHATGYYLNRTLIAMNLESGDTLWTVKQNADPGDGLYEGYWGQAHGPFFAADVDLDGLDEVVGGNLIEDDGSVHDIGYPTGWLSFDESTSFVDHLDGVSVGNFRPDLPGLEWVVTEEDGSLSEYHTALVSSEGVAWYEEINFGGYEIFREPQHTAVGNFNLSSPHTEIWVRSRLGGGDPAVYYRPFDSQWPWVFNSTGSIIATYRTYERLPLGFNTFPEMGNRMGLEMIWTIDWTGSPKENIAAKARWVEGHFGIFDAITCDSLWTSMGHYPSIQAHILYVADIAGDGREEMIVYDSADGQFKVFWNAADNPYQPKFPKWEDPLYRRLKQNWNYYSPGSYTYPDYPTISNVQITEVTASGATITWQTDQSSNSLIEFGTTENLGELSTKDSGLNTSHSIHIDTLLQNTDYYLRVRSSNTNGMVGISHITELNLVELSPVTLTGIEQTAPDQVTLTWQQMNNVSEFNVYRDTDVDVEITPAKQVAAGVTELQWTDPGSVTGDPNTQYFYKVTAISGLYEGDPSDVYGEFDYTLVVTSGTDFNAVGFPLEISGIGTASTLMSAIPGCNSVARWDAQHQGFEQYIPEYNINNFSVAMGQVYYVNVSSDSFWTLTGKVISPSYTLVTSATSSFNQVLLPLDRTDLADASDLCDDIPNCNAVAQWDASAQGYSDQYDPGIPGSDFAIQVGHPYLVNVTSVGTWPSSSASKQNLFVESYGSVSESSQAPHLVWGEPVSGIAGLSAYINSRPGDILTQNSPGCKLTNEVWTVQCGNFNSAWKPGDELFVSFLDEEENKLGETTVTLSSNPSDVAVVTAVLDEPQLPSTTYLGTNYPNPFNPETVIPFALAKDSRVKITIYNLQGQCVRTVLDANKSAGHHEIRWNSRNDEGHPVSGGIYLVRMMAGSVIQNRKIILIK